VQGGGVAGFCFFFNFFVFHICHIFAFKLSRKYSNMKKEVPTKSKLPIQTIGEQRVRVSFNPSESGVVYDIKQKVAELINLCEELKEKDARLASIAQTAFEEAGMWAVKAATA
jgi:hypothetical protein